MFKESKESFVEPNIYFDKSALVLDWLLREGINKEQFSLREVIRDRKVSLGIVQRVFKALVMKGYLVSEGVRTSKRFHLKRPELILTDWLEEYSIVKKCKMWSFRSAFQGRKQLLTALKKSGLEKDVVLALHSAAADQGFSNTNLNTLELYVLKPSVKTKLAKALELEAQERGYEVLLIEPYYKSLLKANQKEGLRSSSILLTFLDLAHFPLRGQEQAEYMAEREPSLKRIFQAKKKSI